MNVMKGIAKGCWLLDHSWVLSSLEKGSWLPEKDYQTCNFGEHVRLTKEPVPRKPVLEHLKVFLQACEDKAELEFLVRSLGGTVFDFDVVRSAFLLMAYPPIYLLMCNLPISPSPLKPSRLMHARSRIVGRLVQVYCRSIGGPFGGWETGDGGHQLAV